MNDEMLSMYNGSEDRIDVQVEDEATIFYYCQYNCAAGEPFSDPNLRLAFDYAINREAIGNGFYNGRNGGVPNGIWCSSTYGYDGAIRHMSMIRKKQKNMLQHLIMMEEKLY